VRAGGPALPRAGATAAVVLALAALVGYPLLRLGHVAWSESGGDLRRVLGADGVRTAAVSTVVLAGAVTATAVPLGVLLALVLRRTDLPGRAFWQVAVLAPVVVPDFVLGYSWTQAYARAGFTDTLLDLHWAGLH
jgi:iron(III) transport system permease protein